MRMQQMSPALTAFNRCVQQDMEIGEKVIKINEHEEHKINRCNLK